MPATKTHQLQLVRTFNAAPEKVYAAWITPAAIKAFFNPVPGSSVSRAEMDVRVGGEYIIQMKTPDGNTHTAVDVYRDIVPNQKLVFTWNRPDGTESCAGENGADGLKDTLVTIEFRPKVGGT